MGINAGFTVNLSGVTIGSQTIGHAIGNGGTLTLSDSTVSNVGGGISNSGTLTLVNSTVSRNFAGLIGAAGIDNFGTATLINSTVIANSPRQPSGRRRHLQQRRTDACKQHGEQQQCPQAKAAASTTTAH